MKSIESYPILVISDVHFGEGDALLRVRDEGDAEGRARVDGLMEWLADHAPFQQIVLLGDIWELWAASFDEAVAESGYFLERLAALEAGPIVYVPGNHDHHLLVQHQLVEQILAMRDDRDLEVPARTQRRYEVSHLARLFPAHARSRFVVSYPDHFARVGGHDVVFHHGHHTVLLHEGPTTFSWMSLFILQRMEEIGLHDVTRSDLELAGTIWFEAMYAASLGKRTRAKMNHLWERFLAVKSWFAAASTFVLHPIQWWLRQVERGTVAQEVGGYGTAVERILALAAEEHGHPIPCDAYVFGHTHRAGIVRSRDAEGRPRILANAGTWLYEPSKRNRASEGTFLLIDDQHLVLYRQGSDLSIRPLDVEPWADQALATTGPAARGATGAAGPRRGSLRRPR